MERVGAGTFIVEGIDQRSPCGVDRGRYCAQLMVGAELKLLKQGNTVQVVHLDHVIGHLPSGDSWVADAVSAGEALRCYVKAIKTSGFIRQRVSYIEIEIFPVVNAGSLQPPASAGAVFRAIFRDCNYRGPLSY